MHEQRTSVAQWLANPKTATLSFMSARREAGAARATRRRVGGPGRSRATYRSVVR